jgi:hypothetical protein
MKSLLNQRRRSVLNLGEAQGQNPVRLIVFSSHFPLKIDDQSRNQVRLKPLSLTGSAALVLNYVILTRELLQMTLAAWAHIGSTRRY